jgi:heat-inducible transcriptional repressor
MGRKPIRGIAEDRSLDTLLAVVRTHIQTGEPVASRTVSRQDPGGLSPASIRTIMMELEEEGYLEQPHTSAGRIPTGKAYRYYVSRIDASDPPDAEDQKLIDAQLSTVEDLGEKEILERTSRVLSVVSDSLGVVVPQPVAQTVLKQIHFVDLGDRRILVVLVAPGQQVQNRVIRVEVPMSQSELEAAANYLNVNFRGWEIARIRREIARRCAEERSAYDRLLRAVRQLAENGSLAEADPAGVFLEGASNLIGRPELAEPARLRDLIRTLEERENVVRLLNECISTAEEPLQVVVGLPGEPPLLRSFALIGTAFRWHGGVSGRMAILGPARMPYDRAMRAMGYLGRLLHQQAVN